MHRLLLIDDDEGLAAPLTTYLRRFDFELESALRPSEGLARLAQGGIDAVILDVMLPEMDGFAVCRQIRRDSEVPILMLTARGDLTDRVVGLELGADDYLPKPFEPRELAARLQTILRRARPAAATSQAAETPVGGHGHALASPQVGPAGSVGPTVPGGLRSDERPPILHFEDGLDIDPVRRRVVCQGQEVELTSTEFELLLLLAREPQRVFTRDEILNRLRGRDADLYTRAVDILISRLRPKLKPLQPIKTLRNAGYTFALAPVRA